MKQAIAREVERVDFDLRVLANVNKANISIRDHSFDFEHGIGGHNHSQLLGRRHHAAHSMNRELLDNSIDRSGQELELCSLLSPCQDRRRGRRLCVPPRRARRIGCDEIRPPPEREFR